MDYMISSSHVNVSKEQQLHHAHACHSATDARLAAARNLMPALHHSQNYAPSACSFLPSDYAHSPASHNPADPLAFLIPTKPSSQNSLMHNDSGANLDGEAAAHPDDVVLFVGKSRQRFYLNVETLISGSAYFKHLLQHSPPPRSPFSAGQASQGFDGVGLARPPILIDCEVRIFEGLLLLMRYGTLEALPPMSAAEIFQLKKEAEFYGIHYMEPPPKSRAAGAESGDDHSDMSTVRSPSSSPSGSPKSMASIGSQDADKGAGSKSSRYHEGVRLACSTQRRLAELPEFPPDLADPARLVLVSCLDEEKAWIYTCDCSNRQWALNFHHRHAFCTACSRSPNVSPKHFAEMFMAAAAHYSSGQTAPVEPNGAWWVSSDSTCMLRFIGSAGDGPDACRCLCGRAGAAKEAPSTIWAANCFYSHAFCTCCGEAAKGPVLLSLVLALRYGGNKASKSARSSFRRV